MPALVSLNDIREAAQRIAPHIVETPLLESVLVNRALGFRLLLKPENLQHSGSFKDRGAFNQILQLSEDEKSHGVFAMSAGNHAQAVARAAQKFRVAATILMPYDAPRVKKENTEKYGAEIVTYNRATEDREAIGQHIARERGLPVIHPYNDPRTIAGQGTIGLEIYHQTLKKDASPDAIIVPCSGGGLSAGIATTRDLYTSPPQIYTAEPAGFDDMRRSLKTGVAVINEKQSGTICDALTAPTPGSNTLPILMHHKTEGFSVSDDLTQAGMYIAFQYYKIVLEPGGAVALAGAAFNHEQFLGKNVAVIASGGNVDSEAYVGMLERGRATVKRLLPGLAS